MKQIAQKYEKRSPTASAKVWKVIAQLQENAQAFIDAAKAWNKAGADDQVLQVFKVFGAAGTLYYIELEHEVEKVI
jgi:hypothetical protein